MAVCNHHVKTEKVLIPFMHLDIILCFLCAQKPVNELGKAYVDFMRENLDQMRQKITDELYTLSIFEVSF